MAVGLLVSGWPQPLYAATPQLELRDHSGQTQSLATLRGDIVVLNFWATWCLPCREEMPLLAALHRDYAPAGVSFVGASADDASTQHHIAPLLEESGVTFPIWLGATTLDMQRFALGEALPATAILDRDGHVAFRLLGPLTEPSLRERLDWLLGDRRTPAPRARLATFPMTVDGDHGVAHDADYDHDADHDHDHDHDHGHAAHTDHDIPLPPASEASLVPS